MLKKLILSQAVQEALILTSDSLDMTTLTSARLGMYFALLHTLSFVTSQPDFSVVGAMKSGTTTLQKVLGDHPNIVMADHEVHFLDQPRCGDWKNSEYARKYFCSDEKHAGGYDKQRHKLGTNATLSCENHDPQWYWLENGSAVSDNYDYTQSRRLTVVERTINVTLNTNKIMKMCTVEDWNKVLPSASKDGQIIGDKAPSYVFKGEVAAQMKALAPDIKIIVQLRDPVERAYSHYKMLRKFDQKHCFHKTSPTGEVMYRQGAEITREFEEIVLSELQQMNGNCFEPYLESSPWLGDSLVARG